MGFQLPGAFRTADINQCPHRHIQQFPSIHEIALRNTPAKPVHADHALRVDIIILSLLADAQGNSVGIPVFQQCPKPFLVHQMFKQDISLSHNPRSVHVYHRVRHNHIPVYHTHIMVHVSAASYGNDRVLPQQFQCFHGAVRNFPGLMVQQCHIQIKADNPLFLTWFLCHF